MAKTAPSNQLTRRAVLAAGLFAAAGCSDPPPILEELNGAAESPAGTGGGSGSGGGGGGGGGVVVNRQPTWTTVPTVTFTLGVPATFSIASFAADPDGDPLTITHSGALPNGVSFDAANKRFVYDGSGVAQSTDNHALVADDLK